MSKWVRRDLVAIVLVLFAAGSTVTAQTSRPASTFENALAGRVVSIGLWQVDAHEFDDTGRATQCDVKVVVQNRSPYHLNKLKYQIGDWAWDVPELVANTESRADFSISINQNGGTESCADQAEYLFRNIGAARATVCTMPGLAEGDCQALVRITTGLTEPAIRMLRNIEQTQIDEAHRRKLAHNLPAGYVVVLKSDHPEECARSPNGNNDAARLAVFDPAGFDRHSNTKPSGDGTTYYVYPGAQISVVDASLDSAGADSWYLIKYTSSHNAPGQDLGFGGTELKHYDEDFEGWVSRQDLDWAIKTPCGYGY